MILLIDLGNSTIQWASWESGELRPGARVAYGGLDMATLAEGEWGMLPAPERVLIANVAGPEAEHALTAWIRRTWHINAESVRPQREAHGVSNAYLEPEQLGVDRWAALVAGHHRLGEDAVIVDCGSAITVDVITAQGEHLGGLIVPGPGLMEEGLEQSTRIRLGERLPGTRRVALLARDTRGAVTGGCLYAAVAFLDRVTADIAAALALQPLLVITGGDAPHLLPLLAGRYRHEPELVLHGLAVIAQGEA